MNDLDSLSVHELARLATAAGLISRIDREGRHYRIAGDGFDMALDESRAKSFLRLIVFRADRREVAKFAGEHALPELGARV